MKKRKLSKQGTGLGRVKLPKPTPKSTSTSAIPLQERRRQRIHELKGLPLMSVEESIVFWSQLNNKGFFETQDWLFSAFEIPTEHFMDPHLPVLKVVTHKPDIQACPTASWFESNLEITRCLWQIYHDSIDLFLNHNESKSDVNQKFWCFGCLVLNPPLIMSTKRSKKLLEGLKQDLKIQLQYSTPPDGLLHALLASKEASEKNRLQYWTALDPFQIVSDAPRSGLPPVQCPLLVRFLWRLFSSPLDFHEEVLLLEHWEKTCQDENNKFTGILQDIQTQTGLLWVLVHNVVRPYLGIPTISDLKRLRYTPIPYVIPFRCL
jgi:hypothetical protein